MRCRYLVTDCTDPYRNLAQEQELMGCAAKGTIILFLWQNENTIVIGRNQDAYKECLAEEFLEAGGHIARRRSGGGAVFHDMGNLNFSIICDKKDMEEYSYQRLAGKALMKFGIKTDFNGRNDLTVLGKKFSGNAAYVEGETVCQHGTILVHTDIEKMTHFLTPDQGKLDRNHVSSVSSRVLNLCEVSDKISIESLIQSMIDAAQAEKLENKRNTAEIDRLALFYSDRKWIYGGIR